MRNIVWEADGRCEQQRRSDFSWTGIADAFVGRGKRTGVRTAGSST